MTETSEIVKRLRGQVLTIDGIAVEMPIAEAADRLEALEAGLADALAHIEKVQAENKRLREALLDKSGPFAVVPAVAPDAAFDAAWERLKTEPHVKLAQRISLHDARMLFRAVWSAMVCACDAGEKERVDRVRAAARAALGEET